MDKPAFNPNAPFQAASPDKPAFDPNAPLDTDQNPSILDSISDAVKRNANSKVDLLRSMVHGATGGFDDEAQGAIQALGEKGLESTGLKDDSGRSLHDMYREYQQAAAKDYKENVHDKNGAASTMGEIAGSIAPVVLSGGLGGPAAETSAIQKIIQGMKTGAKYGAVAGAGNSENNLDTVEGAEGLAKDTAEDSALGAGLGGAVEGGISAIKTGTNAAIAAAKDNSITRQIGKSFAEGTEGRGFGGDANRDRILKGTQDTASDLTQQLFGSTAPDTQEFTQGALGKINDQYGKVLADAKDPIKLDSEDLKPISDVQNAISSGEVKLPKSQQDDLSLGLAKLMGGEMSPAEAKAFQVQLRSLGSTVEGPMRSPFYDAASSIDGSLKEQVPGYEEVNNSFSQARTIPESVISKAPGQENQTYLSDLSKPKQSTYNGFKSVIQGGQTSGSTGRPAKEALLNLKSTLDNVDPATLKTMGIDPDKIISQIQNQGDLDAIMQAVQGHNTHAGLLTQAFGTAKGGAYRLANTVGRVAGAAGNIAGKMVDTSHALVTASPEELSGVASKLSANPSTAHLGSGLSIALSSQNENMKNAALFSILQNPTARKTAFGDNDTENQ